MTKVLITTVPFGETDPAPLRALEKAGIEYLINPLGRRLQEEDLLEMLVDYDGVIAGTGLISEKVMAAAKKLKFISRVGIGLDSVDLLAARERDIGVSYTPDAPAPAVTELTLGLMLNMLRSAAISNSDIRQGQWKRHFGRRLECSTVGVIGAGRIGARVIGLLQAFGCSRILVNDLREDIQLPSAEGVQWVEKDELYGEADLISVHVPLTGLTRGMVGSEAFSMMKPDTYLVNTARGGIVDEAALEVALRSKKIAGASIDVFEDEPYRGPLTELDNCFLTAHLGSMSLDCRVKMEIEATEEIIRFFQGEPLKSSVPEAEYEVRRAELSS